jgi:MFS family permease
MLSKFAKLSLVATSLAPIFLTLWFVDFNKSWDWSDGLGYLITAILLALACWILLLLSKTRLEILPLDINSVRTADNEMVGFILAYLLPLIKETPIQVNPYLFAFIMVLLFIVVFTSNSYHFNPLIGFFGYHFYEVTISGGISYVLISRKNIRNCKSIKKVVQISEYMILEA